MKILVTGARGFVGQHLCAELARSGHEVLAADRENGDLRRPEVAPLMLRMLEPQLVVHLAAKVGRLFGEERPAETITANATMSANVALACGEQEVPLFYVSSSEVYGDRAEAVCREEGPCTLPHNIYGLSKRWGEEVAQLYAPHGLTIARLSMPYGPGHPPGQGRAALTTFLWQAMNGAAIPVHRASERSWCWIGDSVRALRMLIEHRAEGVWNVGRDDDARPLSEVAWLACDLVGAPHTLIELIEPPSRQTVVKRLSTRKLRTLGWQPRVSLEEGMKRTLAWLKTLQPQVGNSSGSRTRNRPSSRSSAAGPTQSSSAA